MPGYNRNEGHILNVLVDHLIIDVHNYRHPDHFKIKSLNVYYSTNKQKMPTIQSNLQPTYNMFLK